MHVEHLLQDESLGLRLLWAEDALLRREISGVTVTDLEDPARFVRPAEVVLSGLVWWSADGGRDKAERFVSGLKNAGAVALLAGEETHGSVPGDLIEACVRHAVPVAGVPAHVMFRAITDAVYLRQWGGLSRHHALPEHVRVRLSRLVAREADPALVLATVFTHLGTGPAYVLTPGGRTVAATPGAVPLPAREAAALTGRDSGAAVPVEADSVTPYERWWLYLPDGAAVPPRLLHEITAVLGRCQEALAGRRAAAQRTADGLGSLLTAPEAGDLSGALRVCGLPEEGPYRVVVTGTDARLDGLPQGALAEAVAHTTPVFSAVGRLPDGGAFAVLPEDAVADLVGAWPLVAACEPDVLLHGGLAAPTIEATGLPGALTEARYALASARATAPGASALTDATTLTSLDALLTGVPAEVRTAYGRSVLGPLFETANASTAALVNTLEVFLAHDGSWARTAAALHLHVNTVHYRIQRIEHFTGRDLSRLGDRLDLWAALSCRTDASGVPAATTGRRARSSTSPERRP
ncbi:PucR family transcriptional regulator [Streptomyces naphthomycinicus]|uniref:PucR family transcriptional regulator n=1 Tax=Streptomyces naphthomycinicus TaxID=2872625 RepID=UPI001CEDA97C|nr:PucR family transcriptional regulator [Streptomyces sp. TML10]